MKPEDKYYELTGDSLRNVVTVPGDPVHIGAYLAGQHDGIAQGIRLAMKLLQKGGKAVAAEKCHCYNRQRKGNTCYTCGKEIE